MFPTDPSLQFVEGLLAATEGRTDKVETAAKVIETRLGAWRASQFRLIADILAMAQSQFDDATTVENETALVVKLIPKLVRLLTGASFLQGTAAAPARIPVLPFQAAHFAAATEVLRQTNPITLMLNPSGLATRVLEKLEPLAEGDVDAALYYLHGCRLQLANNDTPGSARAFSKAADSPSLFKIQPLARSFAAWGSFLTSRQNRPDAEEFRQLAVRHVHELARTGELPPSAHILNQVSWVAIQLSEFDAARVITRRFTEKHPNDVKAWHARASVEHFDNNSLAAVQYMLKGRQAAKSDKDKQFIESELIPMKEKLRQTTGELLSAK
jgi:hypothetical protein